MNLSKLRNNLWRVKRTRGDAFIDIAYEAKVSPMTVWSFMHGETSTPTFLTRWGLRKYLDKYKQQTYGVS